MAEVDHYKTAVYRSTSVIGSRVMEEFSLAQCPCAVPRPRANFWPRATLQLQEAVASFLGLYFRAFSHKNLVRARTLKTRRVPQHRPRTGLFLTDTFYTLNLRQSSRMGSITERLRGRPARKALSVSLEFLTDVLQILPDLRFWLTLPMVDD
jgi:hypothetical protein